MFEELQADGYAWTFTDFAVEFAALDKALNADKTNVIAFRNGYAHGATPTDAQCEADIAKFDPFVKKLLECRWLTTTQLETRDGKVWVVGEGAEVCVHPVLVNKADGGDATFAFFNDLKNDKVGLLNYPLSKHYREKEFFKEFHEFLPLHEWKKSSNNEFYQRIEELTETFKGRTFERERLLRFVRENHKGYCSIQGNPINHHSIRHEGFMGYFEKCNIIMNWAGTIPSPKFGHDAKVSSQLSSWKLNLEDGFRTMNYEGNIIPAGGGYFFAMPENNYLFYKINDEIYKLEVTIL